MATAVVGIIGLATGLAEPLGTLVNVAWVIFGLVVKSILVRAVLNKGYKPPGEVDAGERTADGVCSEVKDSYAEVKADGRLNMLSAPKCASSSPTSSRAVRPGLW
jgi:hypothetical protein